MLPVAKAAKLHIQMSCSVSSKDSLHKRCVQLDCKAGPGFARIKTRTAVPNPVLVTVPRTALRALSLNRFTVDHPLAGGIFNNFRIHPSSASANNRNHYMTTQQRLFCAAKPRSNLFNDQVKLVQLRGTPHLSQHTFSNKYRV